MKKRNSILASLFAATMILTACSDEGKEPEQNASADTLIALSGDTVSKMNGCVLASQYAPGDDIIFRMNAIDPATNEQLKDAVLKVHLSTGEVLDMKYGQHAEEFFWTIKYTITDETPKGQLDYHITAEHKGQSVEYRPFNVAPSLITIVDGNAAPAEEKPAKEEKVDLSKVTPTQKFDLISRNFTFTNSAGEDVFYVKAGEKVTIDYKNEEGMHGFDIEGLDVSVKEAGIVNFTPEKAGEYPIVCNVFCGADHEIMKSKLVVIQ